MINIESLKDYTKKLNQEQLIQLATKIYKITSLICNDYPQYKEWYFKKQLPETITSNKRNILFVKTPKNDNEIISMACLKKDKEEQKICTLYVCNQYRNLKIGSSLVEESMKWLGTTKPLITLADYKLELFIPFIKKYNWELTESLPQVYNKNFQELCFNGTLTKKKK